jgi:catechol 2,3-dioxygenase-like lactoylglutathione lyase family enzyme
MLGISGFAHVSFTVSDLERSAAWYTEVLGLIKVREMSRDGYTKVILEDPGSGIAVSLTHHGDKNSGDPFSECRTGLDHVSFAVPSVAELERWLERLDMFQVPRTEILPTRTGGVLIFRDPDNLQLEFYAAEGAVDEDGRPTTKWIHAFPPVTD